MSRLNISKGLMIATILFIAGFQLYWITKLYKEEKESLEKETDVLFRDVVYKLQLQRFKSDTSLYKKEMSDNLLFVDLINNAKQQLTDSLLVEHTLAKDSIRKRTMVKVNVHQLNDGEQQNFSAKGNNLILPQPPGAQMIVKHFSDNKLINDSLPLSKIDSAYGAELQKNNIPVAYTIECVTGEKSHISQLKKSPGDLKTNYAFVGLSKSYAYRAEFGNPVKYLLLQISMPILISLLLIALTLVSLSFLYRNLLAQQRLSSIKNEFISNITHELKTPIATVNVAIEALRNFNAIQDPERTKEYLDISASELQRLSLLVDKVLRLSMFENREVALNKEVFSLKVLTEEVINIMHLQFQKQHASVVLKSEGCNFCIEADKMHITSVLYNLIDNALKYKSGNPEIEIYLKSCKMHVELKLKDNGIGIPAEYRNKIFEKFFRVPANDVHNTKGYGLGLSYVNHIVQRHQGFIEVESEPGKGSVFTVNIPYKEANEIWFDDKRCIRKIQFSLNKKNQS